MKRMMQAAIATAILAAPAWADEILLKDGQRIAWKALFDRGDSYEVETPDGRRLTVKKGDVVRFVRTEERPALTGAAISFDKKARLESLDLLASADVGIPTATGKWRRGQGIVGSIEAGHARLPLPLAVVPEEYDLAVSAERREGLGDFFVGLIAGGSRFTVHFDALGGTANGIVLIDGQNIPLNESSVTGKVFTNGKTRNLLFMVRRAGLVVQVDGKDFIRWSGDWSRVSPHGDLVVTERNALWLGVYSSTWQISKVVLTQPKPK